MNIAKTIANDTKDCIVCKHYVVDKDSQNWAQFTMNQGGGMINNQLLSEGHCAISREKICIKAIPLKNDKNGLREVLLKKNDQIFKVLDRIYVLSKEDGAGMIECAACVTLTQHTCKSFSKSLLRSLL